MKPAHIVPPHSAERVDARALSVVAGLIGAVLVAAGLIRRYSYFGGFAQAFDLKPPLDAVQTLVLGLAFLLASVVLAIWAHRATPGATARRSAGRRRRRRRPLFAAGRLPDRV